MDGEVTLERKTPFTEWALMELVVRIRLTLLNLDMNGGAVNDERGNCVVRLTTLLTAEGLVRLAAPAAPAWTVVLIISHFSLTPPRTTRRPIVG